MLQPILLIVLLVIATDGQSSSPPPVTEAKAESSVTTPQDRKETAPTPAAGDSKDGMQFGDDAKSELDFFESIQDEIKALEGSDPLDDDSKEDSKKADDDDEFLSVTVLYPDVDRQGDLDPEFGQRRPPRPGVEFDEPPRKVEDRFPPPPLYPPKSEQRPRERPDADGTPLLQLTQGGYQRPYDSPVGQKREPEPQRDTTTSDEDAKSQPRVSYRQPQFAFGPGPMLRSPFVMPHRNFVQSNSILPTTVQNGFLNTPGFTDFANFQATYPTANDNGGYPNLMMRDPGLVPLFQSPGGGILFQNSAPHYHPQPVVIDPSRALQGQLLSGSYDSVEDVTRPDYAAYFRHPTPVVSPQFQVPPNFYGMNTGDSAFNSPFIANNPVSPPFSPRFIRYPTAGNSASSPEAAPQTPQDTPRENQQDKEEVNPNKPDDVPFGTRLQSPPQQNSQTDFYMRYPLREAGYATEESLPSQNGTEENRPRAPRRFFPRPRPFGRDPYRDALNVLQQQPSTDSQVNDTSPEPFFRNRPFGVPQGIVAYPDFPSPAFHPAVGGSRNAFEQPDVNFQFLNPARPIPGPDENDGSITPSCAQQNNASLCFEDEDYPRQDVLYSLNSDAYLLERFTTPGLTPEPNRTSEKSICGADVRYGAPLRGKNAAGGWKIIVNMDRSVGNGRFTQPVRLEVCRSTGDPCSHTVEKVKTTCVQKYSLQSLLSWSTDRGVHSDLYRLPVACSCQLVDA